MSNKSIRELARDGRFIPGRDHVEALVGLLAAEEDDAEAAEKALGRGGQRAADAAIARFADARPPMRGRIARVVGRIAAAEPQYVGWLLDRLDDGDDKTRRNVIIALGKIPGSEVEDRLCTQWDKETRVDHRRSIAASLGKVGGDRARTLLRSVETDDKELERIRDEALVKLERTVERAADLSHTVDDVAPARPMPIIFHVRSGLEELAQEELGPPARVVGRGAVETVLEAPLSTAWRARTALRFGFPLIVPREGTPEERVVAAVTGIQAREIFTTFGRGPIRYRLEWVGAGHKRGATYRVASKVSTIVRELRNDPTKSDWEVVVVERPATAEHPVSGGAPSGRGPSSVDVHVELWPKSLPDPRFAYRVADVPASSHPTIAAALARVAGYRDDEVVWDPFLGAGSELIERARLGGCRAIYGCDREPAAVDAARKNLAAANVPAIVVVDDARRARPPEPVTLVITNPPMGRRVKDRDGLDGLFDAWFANVASALRSDGRVVLLSPLAGKGAAIALKHGLIPDRRGRIDLGGFDAELQVLRKAPPKRR